MYGNKRGNIGAGPHPEVQRGAWQIREDWETRTRGFYEKLPYLACLSDSESRPLHNSNLGICTVPRTIQHARFALAPMVKVLFAV